MIIARYHITNIQFISDYQCTQYVHLQTNEP